MATPETGSDQVDLIADSTAGRGTKHSAGQWDGGEQRSATINRMSVLFLLGACVGFSVAMVGFAANAFYVVLAGSCITLVMVLGWTLTASYVLWELARDPVGVIHGVFRHSSTPE